MGTNRRTKTERLIREYGLDGIGAELEAYWIGEADERRSLRDLAALVNHRLIRATMEDAGLRPTESEVERIHAVLRGDDASTGERIETRRELERNGVDVDGLTDDFVSHQAVRTYLRQCREVEYERDGDQIERDVETLRRLQGRTTAVSERTLERLRRTDRIDLGAFDVTVDVRVFCEDCGTERSVIEILTDRGCECSDD
ncbi:MAG: rod-determining factor RdfA [Halobacteriales archaeon]